MRNLIILLGLLLPMWAIAQEWTGHTVDGGFYGASSVFAIDLDDDGDMDLLGADMGGDVNWWENLDGTGLNWTEHIVDWNFDGGRSVVAADVDGDGDIDVLGAADDANDITWWENLDGGGLTWTEHTIDGEFSDTWCVYAADVDGDTDIDVLGAASNDDEITWWENRNGDGSIWNEHLIYQTDGACCVYATDVDGDGDTDVLGAGVNSGDILYFENLDGHGTVWTTRTVDGNFWHALWVYAADVDGDGDVDVLGAAENDNDIAWWENRNGDGSLWVEHLVDGEFEEANCVFATDVDGDGDTDVLGTAYVADDITWWENENGDGLSWIEHTLDGAFNSATSVYATDIDGDSDIDIIGAARSEITTWWEQPGPYTVRIVSPNGGEAWRLNTTYNIQWVEGPPDEDIYIELIDGPFVEWIISEGTENDGVFEVTVPEDIELGDNYRIRLTGLSGGEQDVSDETFAITALPTLTMSPNNPPVIVPANGEGIWYWVEINNLSPYPGTGQYWTEVILPSGYTYGPLDTSTLTLGSWEIFAPTEPFPQWVPGFAPAGTYEFVMHLGLHPSIILATDSFEFEKLAGAVSSSLPISQWSVSDWQNEAWAHASTQILDGGNQVIPSDYSVSIAYPNPFNASTKITVSLPEASDLNVVVFNVTGQQVAELANGPFIAGSHSFAFDGSSLASGIYLVHAVAPGKLRSMQKVVLVK
jgi:FG-GAP-like repeat/Secretion system C-terminal sorting domain